MENKNRDQKLIELQREEKRTHDDYDYYMASHMLPEGYDNLSYLVESRIQGLENLATYLEEFYPNAVTEVMTYRIIANRVRGMGTKTDFFNKV